MPTSKDRSPWIQWYSPEDLLHRLWQLHRHHCSRLSKEVEEHTTTAEEQELLDRTNHAQITKEQVMRAAIIMMLEAELLDAGKFTLLGIANIFIDCCVQAMTARETWTAREPGHVPTADVKAWQEERLNSTCSSSKPTACMFTIPSAKGTCKKERVCHAGILHRELNASHLRIVDPYYDPHVRAIVGDGCNARRCQGQVGKERSRAAADGQEDYPVQWRRRENH